MRREEAQLRRGRVVAGRHRASRQLRVGDVVRDHAHKRRIVRDDSVVRAGKQQPRACHRGINAVKAHLVGDHEGGKGVLGATVARTPKALVAAHNCRPPRELHLVGRVRHEAGSHLAVAVRLEVRHLRVADRQAVAQCRHRTRRARKSQNNNTSEIKSFRPPPYGSCR